MDPRKSWRNFTPEAPAGFHIWMIQTPEEYFFPTNDLTIIADAKSILLMEVFPFYQCWYHRGSAMEFMKKNQGIVDKNGVKITHFKRFTYICPLLVQSQSFI
jgi:hypothetical protein